MLKTIQKIIATSGGAGYFPVAPGTIGALVGVVIAIIVMKCYPQHANNILLALVILSYLIGVWAVSGLTEEWGDDPSRVVIDETCGIWVALLFIPLTYSNIVMAFVFFRLFDIWKPLFINKIDAMKSSHAVMLDDVVAGVYSNIMVRLISILVMQAYSSF